MTRTQKMKTFIVSKSVMETIQQENNVETDKFLQINDSAMNATSNKDNPKRFLSFMFFCAIYIQVF